jgi:hypothetical protein
LVNLCIIGIAYFDGTPFDCDATTPIGDYPRLKMQYALLKDPYKYWDQQGAKTSYYP